MSRVARVPVVMQMETAECGAASLAMVLAHFGRWLPLERLRVDCGVSRDGATALNIVKAARAHGLLAKGYRGETNLLADLPMPAILHWNFAHFVVLCGFQGPRAVINDPARGRVKITREELDRSFTGIALRLEKGPDFRAEGHPPSVLQFARRRLAGTLMPFVLVALLSVLAAGAGVFQPLFSRLLLDQILSGAAREWLTAFTGAFLLLVLFQVAVGATQALLWYRIKGRFAIAASAAFMWHLLRLPMEFFGQRYPGDLMQRLALNQSIAAALFDRLAPLLVQLGLMGFYLTMMVEYSPWLTAIAVVSVALNTLVAQGVARYQRDLSRATQASGANLAATTLAGMSMVEVIKASGAEAGFFARWAGAHARRHNADVRLARAWIYLGGLPGLLQQIAGAVVLIGGVHLVLRGQFTAGMVLAFQGFLAAFLMPVNQIVGLGQGLIAMRTDMERVDDVLNYRTEPMAGADAAVAGGKLGGRLELRQLSYGYSRLAEPLIRGFSLQVQPGSVVAVVGPSGSGKSTLAKLVAGLYEPWEGQVLYDGRPRLAIDERTFHGSVAMVDQDVTLFEGTVASNIRLWDASVEDFSVILAARDAEIHAAVVARPGGFDHPLAENGANFSGGERQRLEIARALAQEPTLLVLDEATSALDAATEARVMQNIRALGITVLLIAHRLSTVRDCDQIVVLDRGQTVEQGTHAELLAHGGVYARLVSTDAPPAAPLTPTAT